MTRWPALPTLLDDRNQHGVGAVELSVAPVVLTVNREDRA